MLELTTTATAVNKCFRASEMRLVSMVTTPTQVRLKFRDGGEELTILRDSAEGWVLGQTYGISLWRDSPEGVMTPAEPIATAQEGLR